MRNDYGIFFQKQNGGNADVIRLPVNPEKLPIAQGNANDDYNVLGIGPIMVPRIPELKKVNIESYFPGRIDRMTLTSGRFYTPEFYIHLFRDAMKNKEVLTLQISRCYEDGTPYLTGDTGFPVLVTDFQTEERGGETGDFYYTLELTEYRDYSPLKIQIQQEATPTAPAVATTEKQRSVPKGQLYVGASATLNGSYYYDSYGSEPHGNANGKTVIVSRIVTDEKRPYPIHVKNESGGALGWCKKSALQGG